MSGARPKRGLGPDRPSKKKQSYNRAPEPSDTVPVGAGEAHSPQALTNRPFLEGRVPKYLMLGASVVVGIMFILAFSFCLAGGIEHKQPRYFLLLINIILSTGVTGLLIFLYYTRILQPSLIWYVFLQCIFLFFQCVTTDIFAWYESPTASHTPDTKPWSLLQNATPSNHTNNTTIAIAQWPMSR